MGSCALAPLHLKTVKTDKVSAVSLIKQIPAPKPARFIKTPKQSLAVKMMGDTDHTMLYGGSRSGKTTIAVYAIIARAIKKPSRHLIVRHCFNHLKQSIIHDTLPKVVRGFFPGLINHPKYKMNKSDWFLTIPCEGGGTSEIWFGGTDSEERVEKILGNEYSTIYANECSQMQYLAITTLRTRLAEMSGLKLRFYYDCNPPGKKHWTYEEFHEKIVPGSKDKSKIDSNFVHMNPADNLDNLPTSYIKTLESLPKRQRQRYLEGLFLSDIEGALWTDMMLSVAKSLEPGEFEEVVVAVDPAVTNNPNSDETGIIVGARDVYGQGVILDDLSGKFRTKVWAQRAVNAYNKYNANCIIAESNQGGDLITDAIKAIDPYIPGILRHAKKGKFSRAEPVSAIYECEEGQVPKVCHPKYLPELEAEMCEWVPFNSKRSPNRIDALVYALTFLITKRPRERRAMTV